MSNEPAQRQVSDLAMAILRQAGSDLHRMADEPIVTWAMHILGSTAPAREDHIEDAIVPLPISCLERFRTVDYGHGSAVG